MIIGAAQIVEPADAAGQAISAHARGDFVPSRNRRAAL